MYFGEAAVSSCKLLLKGLGALAEPAPPSKYPEKEITDPNVPGWRIARMAAQYPP